MKRIILGYVLCFTAISFAQEQIATIYCNQNQNVAFIMPAPIEQAVTGSEDFVFSYNVAAPDSLGLLQGKPGLDSNLLIRTEDGGVYSYILKYQDTLSRFNYFISAKEQINPPKSLKGKTVIEKEFGKSTYALKNESYFKNLSKYYLKASIGRIKVKRKYGLRLEVKSINHYGDHVFVKYAIENNSNIDYEINTVELYKVQGRKNRKSSFQKLIIQPIYSYRLPEKIHKAEKLHFVITYPKFTIGSNEKLKIGLTETKGNRYLKLML
ncbi:DUF4138 domain-containing protein [Christiangramia sp.]|uniref:DUF4138 domain-containing protein n=1 Tax=Christiangramia sp. TaxID=1931228 RepID=UPI00262CD3EC|nr:DUF4138 domain-containing protein [Christiangramia sp.]